MRALRWSVMTIMLLVGCSATPGSSASPGTVSTAPTSTAAEPSGSAVTTAITNTHALTPSTTQAGRAAQLEQTTQPETAAQSEMTVQSEPTAQSEMTAQPETTVQSETTSPSGPAGFTSTIAEITSDTAARMATSWHPGCPVALADLRYLSISYWDFEGINRQGELVVAATAAPSIVEVFRTLHASGFPIASMRLVDDFAGDDNASMEADNTSAFNCRRVTGGTAFSEHSTGLAIDINPRENPYVSGAVVLPPAGGDFVHRPTEPGVIQDGDVVVQAFAEIGWSWGGHWTDPIDFQHFSASGR